MKTNKAKALNLSFLIILFSTIGNILTQEEVDIKEEVPLFSLETGFYNEEEVEKLEIKSNLTIYYTLDSTDPTTSKTATIYTKAIKLYDRSSEPNVYSNYQGEEKFANSTTIGTGYKSNKLPLDKITVVRAVASNDKGEFGPIVSKVYFVMNKERLEFFKKIPIVSIVTNPENLFDKDIGIYVAGQQYVDWLNDPEHDENLSADNRPLNFYEKGKEWEREADIIFFEKGGKYTLTEKMGIRIKGSAARNLANKSFNVYARKKYSGYSRLKYKLLEQNINYVTNETIDMYDSFGLRGINVPFHYREGIVSSALKDLDILATYDAKYCVLFIDGELWGTYEIMEKASEYFIRTNYDLPKDSIAMMKNYITEEGEDSDFDEFKKYHIQKSNYKFEDDEVYKEIASVIDIDSIILHYAIGIYIGIWDWPNYNLMVWKYKGKPIEGNIYSDGKYRFGSFDFDWSVGAKYGNFDNSVPDYQFDYWPHFDERKTGYPTSIFNSLLRNKEFKNYFIEKFKYVANEVFAPDKMTKILDDLENDYMDYLILNEWRWVKENNDLKYKSYCDWEKGILTTEIKKLRDFFTNRGKYAIEQTLKYLGVQE